MVNEFRILTSRIYLRDSYHNVSILEKGHNFDYLLRGLVTEPSRYSDEWHDDDVSKSYNS